MRFIYVVVQGGCVKFVSTTDPHQTVRILDLDDREDMDDAEDAKEFDGFLSEAHGLVRVW